MLLFSSGAIVSVSDDMNAGFKRSMVMLFGFPLTSILKNFSFRLRILYGPSNGGVSGGFTRSFRMKTCELLASDL